MAHLDSAWRNNYHVAVLDFMIATSIDIEEPTASTTLSTFQRIVASGLSTVTPHLLSHAPAAWPELEHHDGSIDRTPSPLLMNVREGRYSNHSDNNNAGMSSPTSPHLFSTDPTTFSLNSFDYMSSNSHSSSQSPSVVSTDRPATVTRCELCPGKEFTGQAQSQRRSLRRHNHIVHGIDPRPSCSFLGCGESFSRGDNKKRHMERQHGIVPPPKRPATQKRRADEEP